MAENPEIIDRLFNKVFCSREIECVALDDLRKQHLVLRAELFRSPSHSQINAQVEVKIMLSLLTCVLFHYVNGGDFTGSDQDGQITFGSRYFPQYPDLRGDMGTRSGGVRPDPDCLAEDYGLRMMLLTLGILDETVALSGGVYQTPQRSLSRDDHVYNLLWEMTCWAGRNGQAQPQGATPPYADVGTDGIPIHVYNHAGTDTFGPEGQWARDVLSVFWNIAEVCKRNQPLHGQEHKERTLGQLFQVLSLVPNYLGGTDPEKYAPTTTRTRDHVAYRLWESHILWPNPLESDRWWTAMGYLRKDRYVQVLKEGQPPDPELDSTVAEYRRLYDQHTDFSLMRVLPYALFFYRSPTDARQIATYTSRIFNPHEESNDAVEMLVWIICTILYRSSPSEYLGTGRTFEKPKHRPYTKYSLLAEIALQAQNSWAMEKLFTGYDVPPDPPTNRVYGPDDLGNLERHPLLVTSETMIESFLTNKKATASINVGVAREGLTSGALAQHGWATRTTPSRTLFIALWAFFRTEDIWTGLLLLLSFPKDPEFLGFRQHAIAIYGAIAGAWYGDYLVPPGRPVNVRRERPKRTPYTRGALRFDLATNLWPFEEQSKFRSKYWGYDMPWLHSRASHVTINNMDAASQSRNEAMLAPHIEGQQGSQVFRETQIPTLAFVTLKKFSVTDRCFSWLERLGAGRLQYHTDWYYRRRPMSMWPGLGTSDTDRHVMDDSFDNDPNQDPNDRSGRQWNYYTKYVPQDPSTDREQPNPHIPSL